MFLPLKLIADPIHDANGCTTIRVNDGSETGDTSRQPIATVYDPEYAKLIAAAPELLEALQAILFANRDGVVLERDACVTQVRAAIAKATG